MVSPKVTIVVPSIRQKHILEFLEAWEEEFADHTVIVVEDNYKCSFKIKHDNVEHYSWLDILNQIKDIAWIIPQETSACRSFGIYKAYQNGADIIISLDDDCLPAQKEPYFIQGHLDRLNSNTGCLAWESTLGNVSPRGIPYYNLLRNRPVMLNHGLWTKIPDYDAITQLLASRVEFNPEYQNKVIPIGKFFPMCGMNVAFKREIAPLMYHMLQGKNYPYDRFDDIWCGLMMKRICDHLRYTVTSGDPVIVHDRASNVWSNLRKETPGLEINDSLWEKLDNVILTKDNVKDCYIELVEKLDVYGEYWDKLKKAMILRVGLF